MIKHPSPALQILNVTLSLINSGTFSSKYDNPFKKHAKQLISPYTLSADGAENQFASCCSFDKSSSLNYTVTKHKQKGHMCMLESKTR